MRRLSFGVASALLLAGLVAGYLSGGRSADPRSVFASTCKAANPSCPPSVQYRTAAVDVGHVTESVTEPVEPDDGETWAITAYWNDAPPEPCDETSETAYVTVSWNGSQWETSNFVPTASITSVGVCGTGYQCDSLTTLHSWGYRLYARVWDPDLTDDRNLRRVVFTTTLVDDGYVVDVERCTLGSAVSPTSQTFTAYDDGGWPCGFSCTESDAAVDITYE